MIRRTLLTLALLLATSSAPAAEEAKPTKVTLNDHGITLVDGQPFFPIGIWVYELNPAVMADLHEQRFNTVIGNGFAPEHLDLIHHHGMKAVPFSTDAFRAAASQHPAMLAWYLIDEPEGHGHTPDTVRATYNALKQHDPHHPIGVTHFLFEALEQFKGCSDFTMTDVYPVTANRDVPLANVGIHMDEARRVNGPHWPNWTFIQVFGGPDTDGGKWAQPLPHEVRCMTFNALVHRANAILYFSYWPKAPQTWASVGALNRDLETLVPWLIADGEEIPARSSAPDIHLRARKVGDGWLILAVNMSPRPVTAELTVEPLGDATLHSPIALDQATVRQGEWREHFAAYEAKAFTLGGAPGR